MPHSLTPPSSTVDYPFIPGPLPIRGYLVNSSTTEGISVPLEYFNNFNTNINTIESTSTFSGLQRTTVPGRRPRRGSEHFVENASLQASEQTAGRQATHNNVAALPDEMDWQTRELHHFRTSYREDTSVPSAAELGYFALTEGYSALHYPYWEVKVSGDLKDPEHALGDVGHIIWDITGYHGDLTQLNNQEYRRSPHVKIGRYWWNIKLYSHGDKGTEYVSVYLECSNKPPGAGTSDPTLSNIPAAESDYWSCPAQIACVMYNTQDPRVNTSQCGNHHFPAGASDYGWVRFHGPWKGLHRRKHMMRRPLLQNDSISLIVYIRTIEDYTGTLWRQPTPSSWNNIAMTGYRGLTHENDYPCCSSLIAAIAMWIQLRPFRDVTNHVDLSPGLPLRDAFGQILTGLTIAACEETTQTVQPIINAMYYYKGWAKLYSNMDVIEIWDLLTHFLNEEDRHLSSWTTERVPRLTSDFKTVRVAPHDRIRSEKSAIDLLRLDSTQKILDYAATKDPIFKSSSNDNIETPKVMHVELPRQLFSAAERKWKKHGHEIKLDELVKFKQRDYILYGIVVHKGDLGSDQYTSIIRPGGPLTPWIEFGDCVMYRTTKQALRDHEGGELRTTGDVSVAYIAVYIRTDNLENMLPECVISYPDKAHLARSSQPLCVVPQQSRQLKVLGNANHTRGRGLALATKSHCRVEIFDIHTLMNYHDQGFYDVWYLDARSNDPAVSILLPKDTRIRDIPDILVSQYGQTYEPSHCRIFALDRPENSRWTGRPLWVDRDTIVGALDQVNGGCRLWLHVLSPDDDVPLAPGKTAIKEADSESLDLSPAGARSSDDEDVFMDDAEESTPEDQDSASVSSLTSFPDGCRQLPHVLVLVKIFNANFQTLTVQGSGLVDKNGNIMAYLEKKSFFPPEQTISVYMEEGRLLYNTPIEPQDTFLAQGANHSFVMVIQEVLSAKETEEIRSRGDCPTAHEYFNALTHAVHPRSSTGDRTESAYFNSGYISGSYKNGRLHGLCNTIDLSGDSYHGNFTCGSKSGQGVMKYARGDTYEGAWVNNQPHGQGKMTYGKTGNVYGGGWHEGKQHGKGFMRIEMAEEKEEDTCKACYCNEIDAVFVPCGHMVACSTCAEAVEICMVCRGIVSSVQKVYKA
ncbi:hypothetical protein MMC25_000688 [Agyrium rufum]|nr:hypothetical protein [Agyrium rufum]